MTSLYITHFFFRKIYSNYCELKSSWAELGMIWTCSSTRFRGITDRTTDGYCTNCSFHRVVHLFHPFFQYKTVLVGCVWVCQSVGWEFETNSGWERYDGPEFPKITNERSENESALRFLLINLNFRERKRNPTTENTSNTQYWHLIPPLSSGELFLAWRRLHDYSLCATCVCVRLCTSMHL